MDELEKLRDMLPELKMLVQHRRFQSDDPEVRAAAWRLIDLAKGGVFDEDDEGYNDDLWKVTMTILKVRFVLHRQAKLN